MALAEKGGALTNILVAKCEQGFAAHTRARMGGRILDGETASSRRNPRPDAHFSIPTKDVRIPRDRDQQDRLIVTAKIGIVTAKIG